VDARAAMRQATTSAVAEADLVVEDAVAVAEETADETDATTVMAATTAKTEGGATGSLAKSRADQTVKVPG
jgi:hypothetical protein